MDRGGTAVANGASPGEWVRPAGPGLMIGPGRPTRSDRTWERFSDGAARAAD